MATRVAVLIATSRFDFPTDRLCDRLASMDVPFLRLNREDMPSFAFELDPVSPVLLCRFEENEWIVDRTLRSVWWRQPTFRRIAPGRLPTLDEQLDESQWSAFMRGLSVFESARWFNSPATTYRAESKPFQLRMAAEVGFDVPQTRITNDASADISSIIGSEIALKSIDTIYLVERDVQHFGYTQLVSWSDCIGEHFNLVPALCQTVLRDKTDLRVTVVGDQIWCHAITAFDKTIEGDWRLVQRELLQYAPFELPNAVLNCVRRLMARLQLNYGAIDLALAQGTYWFIEVNPTGEWGWLDSPSKELTNGIAKELAR